MKQVLQQGRNIWGGPDVPALQKLAISGNRPPITPSHTMNRRMYTGVKGTAAFQSFLPAIKKVDEEDDEECVSLFGHGA